MYILIIIIIIIIIIPQQITGPSNKTIPSLPSWRF